MKCTICKEDKSVEEFHRNIKKKSGFNDICKLCRKRYHREWYLKNKSIVDDHNKKNKEKVKEYIWNYLDTHPCVDCGESDSVVLEFDHVKEGKLFDISEASTRRVGIKKLDAEIQKCEVRCANCHRKKTAKQFGWTILLRSFKVKH